MLKWVILSYMLGVVVMVNPLEPRVEEYEGDNNPYRGVVNHGVAQTEESVDPPTHEQTAIEYTEVPPPPEPVPVRIVESPGPTEFKDWRGNVFPVQGTRLLANSLKTRTSLHITNDGPDALYLAPDATPFYACPVKVNAGGTFSLDASTEVWGTVEDGQSATARILWEFVVKS